MKKLYISLVLILAGITITNAQNVSFTIKPGASANKAQIFYKSNSNLNGVVSQILLTLTLASSVAVTPPSATFATNASFSQWGSFELVSPSTEMVSGTNTYVYTFFSVPTINTATNTTADVETMIGEVTFAEGTDLMTLKLANLPDGGTSTVSYLVWEVAGSVVSNATALTYGCGSTNSAEGFSGYSFVPLSCGLPVNFLSFYALKNGGDAKLNWTVENDIDNKYFEIQRSTDSRNYTTIGKVNAYNNGKSNNTYESVDPLLGSLGSKLVYYRIKQVDNNGTIIYSSVRYLDVSLAAAINLFPNPARSMTKLVLDVQTPGKGTIIIRDAAGKQVQMINTEFVKGVNQKDLNVSALPSGEYKVTVIGNGINKTLKLSKIN